jgi:hypothetical protein
MIIKIQLPLFSSHPENMNFALVTTERGMAAFVPITDELRAKMAGEVKAFFNAETVADHPPAWRIGEPAPWQEW